MAASAGLPRNTPQAPVSGAGAHRAAGRKLIYTVVEPFMIGGCGPGGGESGAYDARAHALACHRGRRHTLNHHQIGGRTRYRRPYNTAGYQHVVSNWISNSGCRKHKPPLSVVEVSLWHIPGCDQDHSRLTGNKVAGCIVESKI